MNVNLEFILKIIFIIATIIWIGKILILRTDKQIVINPLLLGIASLLAILPQSNESMIFFDINLQTIRMVLYVLYSLVVAFGVYATKRKNGIF